MATAAVSFSVPHLLPNRQLRHLHAGQVSELSIHGNNKAAVVPVGGKVCTRKLRVPVRDLQGHFEEEQSLVPREVRGSMHNAVCRGELPANTDEDERDSFASGRRGFMALSVLLSGISALSSSSAEATEDAATAVPLELYSDVKDGFKLLRPVPWNKVDKPGASIFFEDPNSRSNNIGVTVAPVRIASLDAFGTVDDIVQKLVKAERDKPSTKDMQVVNVMQKKLRDNTSLYSLEYTLDTTRGNKRVLTSVTVAAYKLYVLSIVFADGPASTVLSDALHQVLNSFELVA